ncbi:MAG: HAMP domain-containing protein [Gemmatimonadota bacterium]|nr:HAMP domain-containing protein [Gemmatimonadota bacterium]
MIRSLRFRLAAWHGALTGAIVVVICGYAYAVHARAHYDQADQRLADDTHHVADELRGARTPAEEQEILRAARVLDARMRVYAADGTLALGTDSGFPVTAPRAFGRADRAPFGWLPSLAPSLYHARDTSGVYDVARARTGERWRLFEVALPGDRRLVAALALGPIDTSVAAFGRLMTLMALLGTVLSFWVGWILASRALRPVAAMRETADGIASSRELSRRIPVPGADDELSRLAGTFNSMLGSIEEGYAAQQRFVADASHELRAPLTAIQANLELLRRADRMPAEDRIAAIEEAYAEATRMSRLVADLLALARADAGIPLQRHVVELDRVVLEVVAEAKHLTRGQTLEITQVEPAVIRADPDRVRQLLLILLDNAIRYTTPTGHVTVHLQRADGTAVVEVRDTGVGIAADALPHVFERFYRGDRARARDPGGTGLGLPIARWVAEQHGGTLELASELGRGTTATVRLPLHPIGDALPS